MKYESLFTHLNDRELLTETLTAARVEKAASLRLLDYLCEVDIRRLYAHQHYGSLFEYLVKELGLSEPAASERVSTVRLMRAIPETKAHLENGSLTLTNAAQIQRFIKAEEKVSHAKISTSEKVAVVNMCLNQSKREVEKVLLNKHSEPAKILIQEKVRVITPHDTELKFIVNESVLKKLSDLKNIIGDQSLAKIFELGLDAAIFQEKKKRGQIAAKTQAKVSAKTRPAGNPASDLSPDSVQKNKVFIAKIEAPSPNGPKDLKFSRYIPVQLKRLIFERSQGQCEYIDGSKQKRCASRFRLEIDHVNPVALGGKTESKNLRHLCRAHNLRMAEEMGILWRIN